MDEYTLGTPITVSATWQVAGVDTDPDAVTLKVRKRHEGLEQPTAEQVYTHGEAGSPITKVATGQYEAVITPASTGRWLYRWEGTGAAKGASEGAFRITSTYQP